MEKKGHKGPLVIGYGSLLCCNVSITSARAKALHLHNNCYIFRESSVWGAIGSCN